MNIGDKVVSDDYCAIGHLTKVGNKLMVVGDFGSIDYDSYNGDWELYGEWKVRIEREKKKRGGLLRRIFK